MMRRIWTLILLASACFGCRSPAHNDEHENRLNLILLGYDSLAGYYGNSAKMNGLVRGALSDDAFVRALMSSTRLHAQKPGFSIVVKPTASANVAADLITLIHLLNSNGFNDHPPDTLDATERQFFNAVSLQDAMEATRPTRMQLALPKDSHEERGRANVPPAHQMIVLLYLNRGIFVYRGGNIGAGKKYDYAGFRNFLLANKKKDPQLLVIIHPAASGTYKNTVDMLDEMTIAKMKHYRLEDITKEEQEYVDRIEKSMDI